MISNILKNNSLHHAYLISGQKENAIKNLLAFFEEDLQIKIQGNPDFWQKEFETFGIDDARELKDVQTKTALSEGGKKVFLVSFNFITHEAQNALLKILEEPTKNTHFFIITSNSESLLPTLKSRLFPISSKDKAELDLSEAQEFLKKNKSARLEFVKKIIDGKDKNEAILFLNTLESTISQLGDRVAKLGEKEVFALKEIIKAKKYLNQRGVPIKIVLEHIALIAS